MTSVRLHTFLAICQCIAYHVMAIGVLKEGLIFTKHGTMKATDIEIQHVHQLGETGISFTGAITDLCHGQKHMLLYWTDPSLKVYGWIAIDKTKGTVAERKILMEGQEVIRIRVTPDNSILFLDKGSEVTRIDTKNKNESLICLLNEEQFLFEMFYDYKRSFLYFLEGQIDSSVILKRYEVNSRRISNIWSTDEIDRIRNAAFDPLKEKIYIVSFDTLTIFRVSSPKHSKIKMEQTLYGIAVIPDILFMTTETEGKLLKLHTDQNDDIGPEEMSSDVLKREIPHGDLLSFSSVNFHPMMFGDSLAELMGEQRKAVVGLQTSSRIRPVHPLSTIMALCILAWE